MLFRSVVAFRFARAREKSLLGDEMRLPTSSQVDRRLVLGSLAFGTGWGLAGYCPGPALVSIAQGGAQPLIFVAAMLAGMVIYEVQDRLTATPPQQST